MFQTFSGSSRRPRQVNLSGQNPNPFAASSWTAAASGIQKTVANAQQERQQRQQERDRLNASKCIQKTWRGHKTRRDLADSRRKFWDEKHASGQSPAKSFSSLAQLLQLLLAFFDSRRQDDIDRLSSMNERMSFAGYKAFLTCPDVQSHLLRLAKMALTALEASLADCHIALLQLLIAIIDLRPCIFREIASAYYDFLSVLMVSDGFSNLDKGLIMTAIGCPLVQHMDLDGNDDMTINAHAAFAIHFLTTPNLSELLGSLDDLAAVIDVSLLSKILVREFSASTVNRILPGSRMWLLAHFIALHRLQRRSSQELEFVRALSLQLSSSAEDLAGRIDSADLEALQESTDSEGAAKIITPPLPAFIRNEISSLVNKSSITGLLARFNVDYARASFAWEEDASPLASYALTLLRIFPLRGDEIRMWLYYGSISSSSGAQLPSVKFFWQAMSSTNTFLAIVGDSKAAFNILRPQAQGGQVAFVSPPNNNIKDREWRTILLFLELYSFVLRFTDDEEFLSGGSPDMDQAEGPISRSRESALPLEDVKRLTIFLKNLAFMMFFNSSELSNNNQQPITRGLGTYFGTNSKPGRLQSSSRFTSRGEKVAFKACARRPFAGIADMTFNYVRDIVKGAMRMLYERDSRRRFLPKDHWLMTSRFDMEGFIPAVVMEEERQHQVGEEGEDEDVDDDQLLSTSRDGIVGMQRSRHAIQLETLKRQQEKAARKKVLAAVGPRLDVLQNMPFVIPFETRVQIFRHFVYLDQTRRRGGQVDPDLWRMSVVQQAMAQNGRPLGREVLDKHHAKIRRDRVFEDAYNQFYELGESLKEPIQITFVDKFDAVEAGIDGGGVTKEFLTSVTNEAFRASDGPNLFVTNDQNLLYPNPAALDERRGLLRQAGLTESSSEWTGSINDLLQQYRFLGRIIGKCLYEGILVDIGFAGFFLRKWASVGGGSAHEPGHRVNINDLRDLDESLYQGLLKLKNYPADVEDFSLDFTVTDTVSLPGEPTQTITRDLEFNGSSVSVTNSNRLLYITRIALYRLELRPFLQTRAFLRGLGDIINPSWLSMFNQSELQTLIGGDSSEIDVEDLRHNTSYGGIYIIGDDGLEHPTIQLFWRVMKELDDSDRRKVLKYVTSTPRAPLLGFSQLKPRFSIRDAGNDEERLPSTSTCVNLLKLPLYSSASALRQKLVYAVNSGAGFDLS